MLFSTVNLVTSATAIRDLRALITSTAGKAHSSYTDHDHLTQAIALACLDLDQVDPLMLPLTISTALYRGQDAPAIPNVGNHFVGTQLIALYMPAQISSENLIPFAATAIGTIVPDAIITADLLALIQYPRSLDDAIVSNLNGDLFTVTLVSASNIALYGDGSGPALDGVQPVTQSYVLLIGQTNTAQNGLYYFETDSLTYAFTRPSVSVMNWARQGSTFLVTSGTAYTGKYLQLSTPDTILVNTTPLAFTTLTAYPSNVDAADFNAYILPRAAAYIVGQIALNTVDKNIAASLTLWATQILARPLPVRGLATLRILASSRYAST